MNKIVCNYNGIQIASRMLKDGKVIIFPTDTVYGIGCDPYNTKAIKKIYEIKSRDISKPLPILVDSIDTAQSISDMNDISTSIAKKFWPGPLTIIASMTDSKLAKSMNIQMQGGVALRVPNHKCILELLNVCKMITGTSANISNMQSTGNPDECARSMTMYDMILDGGIIVNPTESTIVDTRDGNITIVRKGKITMQDLQKV